jgi:hypothetical protein
MIYPWEFQDKWRLYIWYPLVNIQIAIENDPIEIVDLPIKKRDFP